MRTGLGGKIPCNFGVVSLGIFLQRRSHRARKAFRRRGRPGSGGNSVYPASTVAVTVDTRIIKRLRDRWLFISDCWLLSYRLIFIRRRPLDGDVWLHRALRFTSSSTELPWAPSASNR